MTNANPCRVRCFHRTPSPSLEPCPSSSPSSFYLLLQQLAWSTSPLAYEEDPALSPEN